MIDDATGKIRMSKPVFANRIIGSAQVAPGDLVANDQNWKLHTRYQQEAMSAILHEVGLVRSVIVNQRTGRIVDGHGRVQLALEQGIALIPVDYVDLSEAEEAKILATFDPIGQMAQTDRSQLDSLLAEVRSESAQLSNLLASLRPREDGTLPAAERRETKQGDKSTDVKIRIGGYVTKVPAERYAAWRKSLTEQVGSDPAAQIAEIRQRLDIRPVQANGVPEATQTSEVQA